MPKLHSANKRMVSLLFTLALGFVSIGLLVWLLELTWVSPDSATTTDGASAPSREILDYSDDAITEESIQSEEENSDSLVIKTGYVEMTVRDLDDTNEEVRASAKSVGGYVESSYDSGKDKDRVLSVTLRIPSAAFDSVIADLKDLGIDIITSREDSSDISEAYTDLQARLKNQKAFEKELLRILEKAAKVEDILVIQKELGRVRENIESLESSIKYYDSQVTMSTVTVVMSTSSESLDVSGDPWRPVGVFREAAASLVYMLKGFGNVVIWLIVLSPLYLVPVLLYKLLKRKK